MGLSSLIWTSLGFIVVYGYWYVFSCSIILLNMLLVHIIAVFVMLYFLSHLMLVTFCKEFILIVILLIIILLKQDIKRMLLYPYYFFRRKMYKPQYIQKTIDLFIQFLDKVIDQKAGVLIIFDSNDQIWLEGVSGLKVKTKFSLEFLNILLSAGHYGLDGGIVIQQDYISMIRAIFPLSVDKLNCKQGYIMGTRHLVAINISDEYPGVMAIVVSEVSQTISIAYKKEYLVDVDREHLRNMLESQFVVCCDE